MTRSGSLPAETLYASTLYDTASSADGDYTGIVNQAITYASGQTDATFAVLLKEDSVVENTEHFRVMIARNAADGSAQALDVSDISVQDNDSVQPGYSLTPASTTVTESNTAITFTVTRSGNLPTETLYASTVLDTASATNGDYAGMVNQAVTFVSGQTSATFTVSLKDDSVIENTEHFRAMIATTVTDGPAQALDISNVYIQDDDTTASSVWAFDASSKSVLEDRGSVSFTLTRSNSVGQETIYVSTVQNWDGGGVYNQTDYTGKNGQNYTFSDGESERAITVSITDDETPESSETFGLNVQSNPNAASSSYLTAASFTITDNDATTPPAGTLRSDAQLFADDGGKIETLAKFAWAAYDDSGGHVALQELTSYESDATRGWEILNGQDFPTLSGDFGNNGIYFDRLGAQALVARSQSSLVLSFRGTELSSGFWEAFWDLYDDAYLLFQTHYLKFVPLFEAIESYIASHADIAKIYVTGHSLGGAMAHAYMGDHQNDPHYEALTVASPGYWSPYHPIYFTIGSDSRITNIWNEDDVIRAFAAVLKDPGDDNVVFFGDGISSSVPTTDQHKVGLYNEVIDFVSYEAGQSAIQRLLATHDDVIVPRTSSVSEFPLGSFQGYFDRGATADELTGGSGDDLMFGGPLTDTYKFNWGYNGRDTIVDRSSTSDVITLGPGTALESISRHGSDVWLFYQSGPFNLSKITIFDYSGRLNRGGEFQLQIADGTSRPVSEWLYRQDHLVDFNATSAIAQIAGATLNAFAVTGYAVAVNLVTGSLGFVSLLSPFTSSSALALAADASTDGVGGTSQSIQGFRDLVGTNMSDVLIGDHQDNVIMGGDGDDEIQGGDGNDTLVDDVGMDTVDGGGGADAIYGGTDDDSLGGGFGNDTIDGGGETDTVNFAGSSGEYAFVSYQEELTVADRVAGRDGVDRLRNTELLKFGSATAGVAGLDTFTPLEYIASYPDLINAFGTNADAGYNHFIYSGVAEGRVASFNGAEYIASYADLMSAFGIDTEAGAIHYIIYGYSEGRQTTFNGLEYIASYGDLASAFGANAEAGAGHYIDYGRDEGRTTTFDGLAYIASYGDLIYVFGANADAGASHYINYGRNEGRQTTFDGLSYIASYGDLINAFGANAHAGAQHFLQYGLAEGRQATFSGLEYTASYADLINAFGANAEAGAAHYIQWGRSEGRQTTFDGLAYIATYNDLINAFGANGDSGAAHFIQYGRNEGRTTTFDGLEYIASYTDLVNAFGANAHSGADHYVRYGYAEGRQVSFSGLEYIASYADLINAFGASAHAGADHYIRFGNAEGRQTSFDGLEYIASYGDLINAFGANADAGASHYINYGRNEGRTEHFNPEQYLANYADLSAAFGSNTELATIHFIQYGYAEGRTDAA